MSLVEGLTINEAARTTGWSPRMLRYVEQTGLVSRPGRRPATASTGRLSSNGCVRSRSCSPASTWAFPTSRSRRGWPRALTSEESVQTWLEAEARRPDDVGAEDWLRFEQEKHQKLLVVA